jgi:negative regulator of sigma E activity
MNNPESRLETLSALADGELGRDELRFVLRNVAGDGALRQRWARWHVVRACLLRQPAVLVDARFADAVMARVAAEAGPAVAMRWLRPVMGAAVAAGVAVLALYVIQPATTPAPPVATLAQTSALRAEDLATPIMGQPVADLGPVLPSTSPVDPQFESYLLRHGSAATGAARGGFVPYVYVVAGPGQARKAAAATATATATVPR